MLGAGRLSSEPNTSKLEVLSLNGCEIDNVGASIMSLGMDGSELLIWSSICKNHAAITNMGWQVIYAVLTTPSCRLEKLDLFDNYIDDDTTLSLTSALSTNSALKSLDLENCYCTTSFAGWHTLFHVL